MASELEIAALIEELTRQIAALPVGSISTKTVRGKQYFYHRVTREGKRTETYVPAAEIDALREQISLRKNLEATLKQLKRLAPQEPSAPAISREFSTYVRTGSQLKRFAAGIATFKRRYCFTQLADYLAGPAPNKILVLYGLRRTGKTTLIRQALLSLTDEQLQRAAFIQATSTTTLSGINADLAWLESAGFEYVFIDEVTLLPDFVDGAALFSDIYAASGMKLVLSGTDSLGFVFAQDDQLYDRCTLVHTTHIPYKEFEEVLGICGIDEYIRYGGTMSLSGVDYNVTSPFANEQAASTYLDSAIARNIQHSLAQYQAGGHFRLLQELYDAGELTSAINRVVEDMNHRFTVEVLTCSFKSADFALNARNLLNDRSMHLDLYEVLDAQKVVDTLRGLLEVLEIEEMEVEVLPEHAMQILEYLKLLDLVAQVELRHLPQEGEPRKLNVISQPGLRYVQAKALVASMLTDAKFYDLSAAQRNSILERVLSEVRGRMMEEIVLLETKLALPDCAVFKLQFAVGEFDMVVQNAANLTCEIFEIKHSMQVVPAQRRHLVDEEKCTLAEHAFGNITNKYVIYRGEPCKHEGVNYLNVETYLATL